MWVTSASTSLQPSHPVNNSISHRQATNTLMNQLMNRSPTNQSPPIIQPTKWPINQNNETTNKHIHIFIGSINQPNHPSFNRLHSLKQTKPTDQTKTSNPTNQPTNQSMNFSSYISSDHFKSNNPSVQPHRPTNQASSSQPDNQPAGQPASQPASQQARRAAFQSPNRPTNTLQPINQLIQQPTNQYINIWTNKQINLSWIN